jgi:hypothetical protein
MAARRLIAILLVLLFLSSLAAALAPVEQGTKVVSTSTSTTTAEAPAPPDTEGSSGARLVSQSVDTSDGRPARVRAKVGDQLRLEVTSRRSGTLELVGLGPAEDVGAQQPAYFDVLLREDGTFPIRFLGTDREVAEIKVSPADTGGAVR